MHVYIHIYACIFVNRTFVVNAVKIRLRLKNTFIHSRFVSFQIFSVLFLYLYRFRFHFSVSFHRSSDLKSNSESLLKGGNYMMLR